MSKLKIDNPINNLSMVQFENVGELKELIYTTLDKNPDRIINRYFIQKDDIIIEMTLFISNTDALRCYEASMKRRVQDEAVFDDFDRYYITYIERNLDPHFFYLPANSFSSEVGFLKQNIVIKFYQVSSSKDVKGKEELIHRVASYIIVQLF
ncbi:MAG: hypothetical protein ACYDEQ_06760 [Desulfocucumaceae bacterium]